MTSPKPIIGVSSPPKVSKLPPNKDLRRTCFVFGFPRSKDYKPYLRKLGNENGKLKAVLGEGEEDGPEPEIAAMITSKKLKQKSGAASNTFSAFLVFESQGQATKFVKTYRNTPELKCIHKYDYVKVVKKLNGGSTPLLTPLTEPNSPNVTMSPASLRGKNPSSPPSIRPASYNDSQMKNPKNSKRRPLAPQSPSFSSVRGKAVPSPNRGKHIPSPGVRNTLRTTPGSAPGPHGTFGPSSRSGRFSNLFEHGDDGFTLPKNRSDSSANWNIRNSPSRSKMLPRGGDYKLSPLRRGMPISKVGSGNLSPLSKSVGGNSSPIRSLSFPGRRRFVSKRSAPNSPNQDPNKAAYPSAKGPASLDDIGFAWFRNRKKVPSQANNPRLQEFIQRKDLRVDVGEAFGSMPNVGYGNRQQHHGQQHQNNRAWSQSPYLGSRSYGDHPRNMNSMNHYRNAPVSAPVGMRHGGGGDPRFHHQQQQRMNYHHDANFQHDTSRMNIEDYMAQAVAHDMQKLHMGGNNLPKNVPFAGGPGSMPSSDFMLGQELLNDPHAGILNYLTPPDSPTGVNANGHDMFFATKAP